MKQYKVVEQILRNGFVAGVKSRILESAAAPKTGAKRKINGGSNVAVIVSVKPI